MDKKDLLDLWALMVKHPLVKAEHRNYGQHLLSVGNDTLTLSCNERPQEVISGSLHFRGNILVLGQAEAASLRGSFYGRQEASFEELKKALS